jgi:uncharacterized protein YigE (DUF2233 family)
VAGVEGEVGVIRAKRKHAVIFLVMPLVAILSSSIGVARGGPWEKIDEGLLWGEFDPSPSSLATASKIVVVKIDPQYYAFRLLCASEHDRIRLTAREWCERKRILGAINAGMYQEDGFTNVGYMRNFAHVNNPRLNSTYKAVVAFNRTDIAVPEIQIIDLQWQDFEALKPKYQTFVQNIRMINSRQENVWAKQDKAWSLAVLGMDKSGNALFIFSEGPYSGHEFSHILLSLPISIYNAMYLEGGPQASLYLSANGFQLERVGIRHKSLDGNRVKTGARPIPNVIGITRK